MCTGDCGVEIFLTFRLHINFQWNFCLSFSFIYLTISIKSFKGGGVLFNDTSACAHYAIDNNCTFSCVTTCEHVIQQNTSYICRLNKPKFKMALENVNILKLSATALAGLFTGGAVFVNIVEVPALRNVTDTDAARKNWKESFLLASRWQVYIYSSSFTRTCKQ